MADTIIDCDTLSFQYGAEHPVLKQLTFSIRRGESVGLLGANGAGKTTLTKLIVGLLPAPQGRLRVFGADPFVNSSVRHKIGVVHQRGGFEEMLTAWDNLYIHGRFFQLTRRDVHRRTEQLLEQLGDMAFLSQSILTLSGGQRRRLQIVRALLHQPQLLLLDEPTVGLDVTARRSFYDFIGSIVTQLGATVIWTSHYFEEIEQNCQRVVILKDGAIGLDADITQVTIDAPSSRPHIEVTEPLPRHLVAAHDLEAVTDGEYRYRGEPDRLFTDVLPQLALHGVRLHGVKHVKPTLEELYLSVTQPARKERQDAARLPL